VALEKMWHEVAELPWREEGVGLCPVVADDIFCIDGGSSKHAHQEYSWFRHGDVLDGRQTHSRVVSTTNKAQSSEKQKSESNHDDAP